MLSFAKSACVLLFVAGLGLSLSSCYDSHLCGGPEECNYDDDDCDDRVDEVFIDETGRYITPEHCGGCGVSCAEVFPTALETECVIDVDAGTPGCRIVRCPEGFHLAGDGACVEDVPVLCLPCVDDQDCENGDPGARCVATAFGMRCAPPCSDGCPEGSECRPGTGFCFPVSGDCTCSEANDGLEIGCLVDGDPGHQCAGAQVCAEGPAGFEFSGCAPALSEACNAQDDDCDGQVDEDFRDDGGRYVARLHCGGCAIPCVEPGPNMVAQCLPRGPGVMCTIECEEGFVNVDGIDANGCECERWDGIGPPPAVGVDSDCDGIVDDSDEFIFVTPTGSDRNPGTLVRPVRTIARAQALGRSERKNVLVSRGVYDGSFDMVSGVDVFGGYRADFRDRDLLLYPVLVERRDVPPGTPVLTCNNIVARTVVDGFTIQGSDAAEQGGGSTAVYLNGCGPAVELSFITILAGRAAPGVRGESSSDNLADWGLRSLDDLRGADGQLGAGTGLGSDECSPDGGNGGPHSCRVANVSGGNGGDGACPDTRCQNGRPCGNAGCTDFTVGGVCNFPAVLRAAVANPSAQDGRGLASGAAGVATYNAPTNRSACNFCDDNPTLPRLGQAGSDGGSGGDGTGGGGCSSASAFDSVSGRVSGRDGQNGTQGSDGSGGGGGSAGGGYAVIGGTPSGCEDRAGGAGGGGGSGGCGAPGAGGGTGGGTSTGVVVRLTGSARTGPSLREVRIVTASGGTGGDGGTGAEGGSAGTGGLGGEARFWCSRVGGRGGDGGEGGAGGGGGGGCGGSSHGVLIVGRPVGYEAQLAASTTIERVGVAGRGGQAGFSPGRSGSAGREGTAEPIVVLP